MSSRQRLMVPGDRVIWGDVDVVCDKPRTIPPPRHQLLEWCEVGRSARLKQDASWSAPLDFSDYMLYFVA